MFHELKDKMDVETPLGWGKAFLIESKDNDYYWNVILADSGDIVCFPQSKVKFCRHYSLGVNFEDDEMKAVLKENESCVTDL